MSTERTSASRIAGKLTPWMRAVVEESDSFRFEALTLLEEAKSRLAELEARPPADTAAAGVAAMQPIFLAAKALLAARAVKAHSTATSLELLKGLYPDDLPGSTLDAFVEVQSMKLQGAKAVAAARSFVDNAARLLTR